VETMIGSGQGFCHERRGVVGLPPVPSASGATSNSVTTFPQVI
jgi:hypothetical protein